MASGKITKPDSKKVSLLISETNSLLGMYEQIASCWNGRITQTRNAAQALFDYRVDASLAQMDIAQINKGKFGIRIPLLREAGVENVLQASRMSFQQLCDIDGIGDQSASKIMELVGQIRQNTRDTIRIRIHADAPHKTEDALIRCLYILLHAHPLVQSCGEFLQRSSRNIKQDLHTARDVGGSFGWMFKSTLRKQQIVDAVQRLEDLNGGEYGSLSLKARYASVFTPSALVYWDDFRRNASTYYAQLEQLGLSWNKETDHGLPAQLAAQVNAQPLDLKYLNATLRNYQTFGVKYIVHQKKALLGDDMGLGKTIQAIAAMCALKAEGKTHFMVVCPASVLINWCREIPKFSSLEVTKVHGNDEEALLHWRENGDVCVTTFESISRFKLPPRFPISMIVTDEAHYVKNPDTQRTKALLGLLKRTERILFMSGTPLENRVEEMCFLVSCLQPDTAKKLEQIKFLSTAQQFRQQLSPVYLRRTRDDVLQELPDLMEKEQWCTLGKQESRDYYDAVMSDNFMAMRQVSWQVDDWKHSSKALRLVELCDQAKEQGRKIIVFSFFLNTLRKAAQVLGERCMEPITGGVSPQRRQEIIDGFHNAPDGAVLLSQVQAGGTGLNIQSASVIIFCEPQIKPSIENQAIARAYRMGQVRDVLVYRLLADDTIDERIMELLRTKQELFDNFADESAVGQESLKPRQQDWISRMVAEEKARLQTVVDAPKEDV